MRYQNNIKLTEENYIQYKNPFIKLYVEAFSGILDKEELNPDEIEKKIKRWLSHKDNLILLKFENDHLAAFCAGYNTCCAESQKNNTGKTKDIWETFCGLGHFREEQETKELYFIDSPVASQQYKDRGYVEELIEQVIFSKSDDYCRFLLMTHRREKELEIYKERFRFIPLEYPGPDKGFTFLELNRAVKKVTYMMLLATVVKECGEELTEANYYDSDIILRQSEIGLTPYNGDRGFGRVRKTVAEKLSIVNSKLKTYNRDQGTDYRLLLLQGYKSLESQNEAFHAYRQKLAQRRLQFNNLYDFIEEIHRHVAVPTVAGYPTGGAVNVTIFDNQNRSFPDMGSHLYEYTSDKTTWDVKGLTPEQKANRQLLFDLMTGQGFAPFHDEWWRYSYGDREWAVYYNEPHAIYDHLV